MGAARHAEVFLWHSIVHFLRLRVRSGRVEPLDCSARNAVHQNQSRESAVFEDLILLTLRIRPHKQIRLTGKIRNCFFSSLFWGHEQVLRPGFQGLGWLGTCVRGFVAWSDLSAVPLARRSRMVQS